MSAPTALVRRGVMERDGRRCVSCGTHGSLTFQHRRAVGMGGSKVRPTFADGLAACACCNASFEGALQAVALVKGWKVAKWVQAPERVPYHDEPTARWHRLSAHLAVRFPISAERAEQMMREVYGDERYDDMKARADA